MQKYTSANTSINSTKLPRVYNLIPFKKGDTILDYGCGRYTSHIQEKMETIGCEWHGYDKFNQSMESNDDALRWADFYPVDYVICSNVLNVIDNDSTLDEIIDDVIMYAHNIAIFTIYEGNRSGIGKPSKADCYQRNEKISVYVDKIKDRCNHNVTVSNGMIIVKKGA